VVVSTGNDPQGGRHWVVGARKGWTIWWEADGGTWQASGVRIHEVAAQVERGELPMQNVDPQPGTPPAPAA
jgi:hypothetical protein